MVATKYTVINIQLPFLTIYSTYSARHSPRPQTNKVPTPGKYYRINQLFCTIPSIFWHVRIADGERDIKEIQGQSSEHNG